MVISDKTLKKMLASGELVIEPLSPQGVQCSSVDCRLGNKFLLVEDTNMGIITLDSKIVYREIESESIIIPPKSFVLATTQEYIKLPDNVTSFVEGRSSIGRMGLFIENAGWVDAGFEGRITLELFNANSLPIKLDAGRRVCQLVFVKMDQSAQEPYSGKYQGQQTTVGSRVYDDAEACLNNQK